MKLNSALLFIIPSLIWGSTWYAITFQLGKVDPLLSVGYRFALAGVLLLGYARLFKLNLKFTSRDHFFMMLQGFLLFGLNYWLVYLAELYLTSGLVAVVFSILIFMNIFFAVLILKNPIRIPVVLGAVLGLLGTAMIFKPELSSMELSSDSYWGLFISILSVTLASLGNITSAYNQRQNLPVIQVNAFGMIYGALLMFTISVLSGKPFTFDASTSYVLSLFYLAIFGSIIAFGCYLTLIGRIGPDKAAYSILVIPVIALIISAFFEDYQITIYTLLGVGLILVGNLLALRKKQNRDKSL